MTVRTPLLQPGEPVAHGRLLRCRRVSRDGRDARDSKPGCAGAASRAAAVSFCGSCRPLVGRPPLTAMTCISAVSCHTYCDQTPGPEPDALRYHGSALPAELRGREANASWEPSAGQLRGCSCPGAVAESVLAGAFCAADAAGSTPSPKTPRPPASAASSRRRSGSLGLAAGDVRVLIDKQCAPPVLRTR